MDYNARLKTIKTFEEFEQFLEQLEEAGKSLVKRRGTWHSGHSRAFGFYISDMDGKLCYLYDDGVTSGACDIDKVSRYLTVV